MIGSIAIDLAEPRVRPSACMDCGMRAAARVSLSLLQGAQQCEDYFSMTVENKTKQNKTNPSLQTAGNVLVQAYVNVRTYVPALQPP